MTKLMETTRSSSIIRVMASLMVVMLAMLTAPEIEAKKKKSEPLVRYEAWAKSISGVTQGRTSTIEQRSTPSSVARIDATS